VRPLAIHFISHLAALALVTLAIAAGSPLIVRLGAAAGIVGALAFGAFFATAMRRMRRSQAVARAGAMPLA
jgi:hypothetical protein